MAIVAGGGASGLNIVPIARELGCRSVLLPSTAGALSACGALYSDVVSELSASRYVETRSFDLEGVNETLAAVEAAADEFLDDLADIGPRATRKEFMVEARYRAQVWELDVPIPPRFAGEEDVRALEEAFHRTHERVFAVREPGQYLECLLWKARATAVLDKPQVRSRELTGVDGRPDEAEAERAGDRFERGPRRRRVEVEPAAEEVPGVDPTEDDGRVGDGGLDAATAVAGRAGVGARAPRADAQEPARVDPDDRASSGADRLDVHGPDAGDVAGPAAA